MKKFTLKTGCLAFFFLLLVLVAAYFAWQRLKPPISFSPVTPAPASQPYGYDVLVQPASPWPTFRRDRRNTGASSLPAVYSGDLPWAFQTGKGIFSTPVIDADGLVYFGSADHFFYALNPDGTLSWKYETGEIIDSAGALTPGAITFISGDGRMYHFRTGEMPVEERPLWIYEAGLRPGISYNRWFEGNVAVGFDGTFFAGNTNFLYYAIHPDGTLKWTYETASNNWSQAAFSDDGAIYWGSNDTYIRAVSPAGEQLWQDMTLGFIAASAAVGSDGTVYIGSFDSNLYALEPSKGIVKWKYPTADHIYTSAALESGADGHTTAILFGSADGFFYAVDPHGELLWKYAAGDPIRSSPALGLTPDGKAKIVYFGAGNGRLYALNAEDGSLRWSFDTTAWDNPELADRNDLNGSVALGTSGVYVGGEHGQLWYVPYDYCLNHSDDPRCVTQSEESGDFTGLYYVTPGGNTSEVFPATQPASAMFTLRLVVRQGGETLRARLCDSPLGCPKEALVVSLDPPVPLDVQHSADGKFIYLRPLEFLSPGQEYTLQVRGKYYTGGLRLGNLTLGGSKAGEFDTTFSFQVENTPTGLPLQVGAGQTTAFEWTRLAAPIPTMLPSLNQIGFDYIDWLVAPLLVGAPDSAGQGRFILWAIGARKDSSGALVPDPDSDFILPLNGRYQGADFVAVDQNFPMPITGIRIPFNLFEVRGQFTPGGVTLYPAAYASADTLSIPTFGPYLVIAGLANNWYKDMLVAGTYVTRPYDGPANHLPEGVRVSGVDYVAPGDGKTGSLTARFTLDPGTVYPAAEHRPGLLLVDPATSQAVYLDYKASLSATTDSAGNLQSVTLTLPEGLALPEHLDGYVMLDVFPVHRQAVK